MSEIVRVTALFFAKEGDEASLLEALRVLAREARKEKGCLRYEMHLCADNPRKFLIFEEWESLGELESHVGQPHVAMFRQNADVLMQTPADIQVWKETQVQS